MSMIKARLVPAPLRQDLAIGAYREILQEGRKALSASRRASRAKTLRYAKHIRARGFSRGYQEGLKVSSSECKEAVEELRNCYQRVLDNAQQDLQVLAEQLASQIIDATIVVKPEIFAAWILEARNALKASKAFHLSLNPRYQNLLEHLATTLPEGIATRLDPTIGSLDFRLEGDVGGVEFAWRKALTGMAAELQARPEASEAL
jgi:flagellar biosynthesis/type III secretory pathway protein FliH